MDDELQEKASRRALVSETIERVGWNSAMRDRDASMAAWRRFEASWTEHERERELGAWSRARAAEFISMTAQTVGSMFESPEDAGTKALTSFAFRMLKAGRREISAKGSFEGSVFGCLREEFAFEARLLPTDPSSAPEAPRSTRDGLLGAPSASEPHEKLGPLWSDASGCLGLWDSLRESLGDEDGTESARAAALLLVHFDYLSWRNIGDAKSSLIGMTETADDGSEARTGFDAATSTSRVAPRALASAAPRSRF